MFSDNIQIIQDSFLKYKGTSMYFALFAIAELFIFLKEKDKNHKTFLLYYSCFALFIILNPIFQKCVNKILDKYVYWRTFWILPIGMVIAYVATCVIKEISRKSNKIIVFFTLCVLIIASGQLIYTSENYQKVNNLYKLPDESVEIVEIISKIPFMANKKVMTSTALLPDIRQLNEAIQLAYRRVPNGQYDKYPIVDYYNSGDVENLMKLCQKENVNILIYDNSIELAISPTHYGFALYAQTQNYDIYIPFQNLEFQKEQTNS